MTTSSIQRPTEAICPPWCSGHLGGYGAWETLTDGSGVIREHSSVTITVDGVVSTYLNQTEAADRTLGPVVVNVCAEFGDNADLTPGAARAYADALIMLAKQAEELL
jgi:hypothetical protein